MEENVITIRRFENGEYDVKSGFPGPHATVFVLREVIAAVEKAALEAELQQAQGVPLTRERQVDAQRERQVDEQVPRPVAGRMNGALPEG